MALGVTLSTPDTDRVSYSREDLEAKISVSLGGRVAEEVVYGKITTGAESDIQQLTRIARQMVGRWGMSDELGPVTWLASDGNGPLLPGGSETSQQTQWLVDQEIQRIVGEAHAAVTTLLTGHRDQLESLTQALIAAETLDAPEAYAAAGVPLGTEECSFSAGTWLFTGTASPTRALRTCVRLAGAGPLPAGWTASTTDVTTLSR
jgi:cell division protease FtsH